MNSTNKGDTFKLFLQIDSDLFPDISTLYDSLDIIPGADGAWSLDAIVQFFTAVSLVNFTISKTGEVSLNKEKYLFLDQVYGNRINPPLVYACSVFAMLTIM